MPLINGRAVSTTAFVRPSSDGSQKLGFECRVTDEEVMEPFIGSAIVPLKAEALSISMSSRLYGEENSVYAAY